MPKVENPASPDQYRPISLTNFLYKISAKVLNRLFFMDSIISPWKSAFKKRRCIQDNILLCHDMLQKFHLPRVWKLTWGKRSTVFTGDSWKLPCWRNYTQKWIEWIRAFITTPKFGHFQKKWPSMAISPVVEVSGKVILMHSPPISLQLSWNVYPCSYRSVKKRSNYSTVWAGFVVSCRSRGRKAKLTSNLKSRME